MGFSCINQPLYSLGILYETNQLIGDHDHENSSVWPWSEDPDSVEAAAASYVKTWAHSSRWYTNTSSNYIYIYYIQIHVYIYKYRYRYVYVYIHTHHHYRFCWSFSEDFLALQALVSVLPAFWDLDQKVVNSMGIWWGSCRDIIHIIGDTKNRDKIGDIIQ